MDFAKERAKYAEALEKQSGGKIATAWTTAKPGEPHFIEVRDVRFNKEPGDTRPTCFLKLVNLETGKEEERPVPDWFQTKLEKAGLLKRGSRVVVGYFGMVKNKKTGQDVHDFRALGYEA